MLFIARAYTLDHNHRSGQGGSRSFTFFSLIAAGELRFKFSLGYHTLDLSIPVAYWLDFLPAVGNYDHPVLQFMAVRGRSYTVYGSSDLQTWTAVALLTPPDDPSATAQSYYYAGATQMIQVAVKKSDGGPALTFFKVLVQ